MTDLSFPIHSKERLKDFEEEIINQQISRTRAAMDEAQAAANLEGRGSAGRGYHFL